MKRFLLLILFFISSIGVSQDFPDGMVVVEFNASFNKSNEVTWLSKLSDCEIQRVDIAADSRWASEYKIVVVPTIVIYKGKSEVYRSMGVTKKDDLFSAIDEIIKNKT